MKAIPYIRFSSQAQSVGSSVARQNELIGKWLIANPTYTLSTLRFEDLGISGWSNDYAESGGFSKLIAAIEAGAIKAGDAVLVEAMDRAGRLPALEMVGHISKILNAGVLLVTLDDGMTYTQESANGQHLFLLVAKFQQANQYSEALSRRIKASYADRRAKATAGVSIKRSTPVWLNKEGQLIESVAPFIVQAFEDYAIGLGERRIFDRIHDKHPLLSKLNPSTIKRWMSNTTAIGYWGDIPDVHPPVVSKELFYRVQRRLDTPSKPKAAPTTHLLTGLVKCGECGSNMIYKALKHSPHVMACGKRARFGVGDKGCSNKTNWPVLLIDYIRSNTMIGAVQRAMSGLNVSENEKKRIELEGEINAASKAIGRLVSVLAEHDIQEVRDSLSTAVAKRESLQEALALVVSSPIVQSFDLALDHSETLLDDDTQRLNALLQGVGYAINCNGKIITVNEPSISEANSISSDATTQTYEYLGVHRASDSYKWLENGLPFSMAKPNPVVEAKNLQESLNIPTENYTYINGELVLTEPAEPDAELLCAPV